MEAVLIIITLILLGAVAYTLREVILLKNRYGQFLNGAEAKTIERLLKTYAHDVAQVDHKLEQLAAFSAKLHQTTGQALTRQGFVRFNPFNDTGGDQSFCLAAIDAHGNGFVLSSIHARTGTRMYAKEIIKGESPHHLSDEESVALKKALDVKLPFPQA